MPPDKTAAGQDPSRCGCTSTHQVLIASLLCEQLQPRSAHTACPQQRQDARLATPEEALNSIEEAARARQESVKVAALVANAHFEPFISSTLALLLHFPGFFCRNTTNPDKKLAQPNKNDYHLHHWLITSEQSATLTGYGISSSGLTRCLTRPCDGSFFA